MIFPVYILPLLIIISAFWISIQDFKNKEVSVFSLFIFSALLLIQALLYQSIATILFNIGISLIFVAIQTITVGVFFWQRNKSKKTKLRFTDLMGGADIWILLSLILSFNWMLYVFFITAATILTLIAYAITRIISSSIDERIPLAGYLCIFYCIVVIATIVWQPNLPAPYLSDFF